MPGNTRPARASKRAKARPKARVNSAKKAKTRTYAKVERRVEQISYPEANYSYEEAMLDNMIRGAKAKPIPEEAVAFSEILSNLTKNMKTITYRFGINVGRDLYRTLNSKKHYYWYEESIPDMVAFLEKSGYKDVAYTLTANGLRLRIYNTDGAFMGASVHTFESGLMSGFLSAASRQMIHVNEESCVKNGADYCEFVSSQKRKEGNEIDMSVAVESFAQHLKMSMHGKNSSKKISSLYHALSVSPLLNRRYSDAINNIVEHMGYRLGDYVFDNRKVTSKKISDCISKTASLLNFGEPSIRDSKELDMKFSFSPELSRKEYINLSLSFMDGIASKAEMKNNIYSTTKSSGGRYVLHIKEKH